MATKRKKKTKAGQGRSQRGRGRRVLLVLLFLVLVAVGAVGAIMATRSAPEIPVPVSVSQSVGMHGAGPGALDSPRGIAVGPDGSVYVADLSNARIAVFDANGVFKFNFGKIGVAGKAKPGEFNEPSGVAVAPDGTIYVADAWNGRVQKFDPKGKPLGEYGGAHYSFYSPRNVAVDRAGNLYVADTGNSAVKVIDPTGKLIKTLGGPGSGGGLCQEVFGVAVNSRGEIFVADHGNKRIHKFSPMPAGEFIKDRKVPGWQVGDVFWPHLAVDSHDMVYAMDSGNRKIWIYDSDLNYRGTIGGEQGQPPFAAPLGLAFAPGGQLWVSDMANNRLLKLAPFNVPAPSELVSKSRLGRASLGLIAANAVANLSMVLYHRLLSQRLGDAYAQLTALMAVVNVLGNVTLGLNTYLVKAFSADAELKGPGAVKGRLMILLRPGLLSLGLITALLAAVAPWIATYLKLPGSGLVLTVDVLFATGVLMLALRAAQQGLHHFGWLGVSVAGEGLTRVAVVAAPATGSVGGGLLSLLAGQIAGIACAAAGLVGLGPARRPMKRPKGEHALRHALQEGGSDTLALTLLALVSYLDVVVLKHYYPDTQAGLYSRAALVAKSFLYLPAALNMVLLAASARELAGGRDPRRLLERFLSGALVLDLLGLAAVWWLTPFCLRTLAGADPSFTTPDMVTLTRWFSLAVIPLGLLQMVVAYLLAIRRRGVALITGALAVVYLALLQMIFVQNAGALQLIAAHHGDLAGTVEGEALRVINLKVVGSLGLCSMAALVFSFWSAMTKPPRRDEWGHT